MESLNLYQVFYEVAKCHSFSLAAQKLYISQPAISKSIFRLEEELNTTLFYRSSKGAQLTPEGDILFKHVEKALASLHDGENMLKSISEKGIQTLSVGVSTTLCKYVLLPALKDFLNDNPNVKLNISCQPTSDTLSALKQGRLDLGLIGMEEQNALAANELSFFALKNIEDIFVSTDAYLTSLKNSSESPENSDELKNAVFILLNKENISRKHIDTFFHQYNIMPENIMEVNHMDLAIDFAKAGLGIACVISDFVQNELKAKSLVEVKIGHRIPRREIAFACPSQLSESSAASSFIQYYQHRF